MPSSSEDISGYNKQEIINRTLQCVSVKCDWFYMTEYVRSVASVGEQPTVLSTHSFERNTENWHATPDSH
jgi:hypothetical protein